MPFDPQAYEQTKKSLKPVNSGFNPAAYEQVKATVSAPPPTPGARTSPVVRALDFMRRAFMGESNDPRERSTLQNVPRDAGDIITGTSHLAGQGLMEMGKMGAESAMSSLPSVQAILGLKRPTQALAET